MPSIELLLPFAQSVVRLIHLLFCIGRERIQSPPDHKHQPEFESSAIHLRQFTISSVLRNSQYLEPYVYRAKGFVQFPEEFNFVAGRWDLNHLNHRQQNYLSASKSLNINQIFVVASSPVSSEHKICYAFLTQCISRNTMPYEFLEDVAIADIAFRAWGTNLEELFKAGGCRNQHND